MRRTVVLFLLLAGCASRDGFIDERIRDCSAGQELSIDLRLNMPKVLTEKTGDDLTVTVMIANNSTRAVEVKSIRVEPGFTAQERYALESSFSEFHQVIEAGDDEEFELPVRGQAGMRETRQRRVHDAIEIILSVYMADGDTYRCSYDVQAPR